MADGGTSMNNSIERKPRIKASAGARVLALYSGVLLAASILLPWWRMECRAPQYGARVLIVEVTPGSTSGDTREIDNLGHYVGLRSMETFAKLERTLAPFGLLAVALLALSLPFLPSNRLRVASVAIIALVPILFAVDLKAWQHYAATHLDPNAALSLIQDRIQTKLVGEYQVAQFNVKATFQEGFWLSVIAAFNGLGFLFVERKEHKVNQPGSSVVSPSTIAVGLFIWLFHSPANAKVLEVGELHSYRTIGAAITAAQPGDELLLDEGVYKEQIKLEKPLTITGKPGTIIQGSSTGTVLLISEGPCKVRGLTIRGSGESLVNEDSGIKLLQAQKCVIQDNKIEDVLFGIFVISSSNAEIQNNTVTGKDLPPPRRGDGIRLYNSHNSHIDGNRLVRTRDLAIWQSNHVSARRNILRENRYGLHYMYCDDSLFEDNVFEDNQVGAAIMYSRRLTLRNNRFVGSRGVGAVGLFLKVADDVVAEDNWIIDNSRGIFLDEAPQGMQARCILRNNIVGGNDIALSMQPSVDRAEFSSNSFIANRVQVEILGGSIRPKDFSISGKGNYWSDYLGFDANEDGIGDTPYQIEEFFESLTRRWPELGILRMSPAAGALETASRAFPVGKPRISVIDHHPLIKPPQKQKKADGTSPNLSLVFPGLIITGLSSLLIAKSRHIK